MVEEQGVVGSMRSHLWQCGGVYLCGEQENWREMVGEREGWQRLLHPMTVHGKDTLLRAKWPPWKVAIFLGKGPRTSSTSESGDREEADLEPDLPPHPTQQSRGLEDPSENSRVRVLGEPGFRHPPYRGSQRAA